MNFGPAPMLSVPPPLLALDRFAESVSRRVCTIFGHGVRARRAATSSRAVSSLGPSSPRGFPSQCTRQRALAARRRASDVAGSAFLLGAHGPHGTAGHSVADCYVPANHTTKAL